jgi:hypothetical protein
LSSWWQWFRNVLAISPLSFATMPLTAPLAMWIVFSASRGDQRQTADFAGSMVIGSVASLLFVLACWLGLRQEWGFLISLALASTVWLLIVLIPPWIGHSGR